YLVTSWLKDLRWYHEACPQMWEADHDVRLWTLDRWIDVPGVKAARHRPQLQEVLAAWKVGAATETDIYDHLLGPRGTSGETAGLFGNLSRMSGRKPHPWFATYPGLESIVDRCRQRIVEIESKRGELPTVASPAARSLRAVFDIDALFSLIHDLGGQDLQRSR